MNDAEKKKTLKPNNQKRYTLSESGKKHIIQYSFFSILVGIGALVFILIFNQLPPHQQTWYSALSLAYFIPPAGKETVIPLGLSQGIPAHYWAVTLWVFDLLVSIIIITNWWIIELLIKHIPAFPFIGIRRRKPHLYKTHISLKKWYDQLHQKTEAIKARRYGTLLPLALLIFMFIPFQGTGAMSTTIIGTGLGFPSKQTFTIVAIGSLLTILFMILLYTGVIQLI
ncbi:MAG: small multi-drug export protein [Candidatus Thermoplasmatota archaeon]